MRERISKLLQYYRINQTEFAQRIGLSKGMVSHVMSLSGRGSSFTEDTINKILSAFPEIEKDWLVNGIGDMTKVVNPSEFKPIQSSFDFSTVNNDIITTPEVESNNPIIENEIVDNKESHLSKPENYTSIPEERSSARDTEKKSNASSENQPSLKNTDYQTAQAINSVIGGENKNKVVSKIVIFYKDGTFSLYQPDSNNY